MPKKGKGKKGKGKTGTSQSNVQETQQQQEQPSASEAGRGRGRGRGESSEATVPGFQQQETAAKGSGRGRGVSQSGAQESVGIQPEKAPAKGYDKKEDDSFFESSVQESVRPKQKSDVPKGRGRGRGVPSVSSAPRSPGTPEEKTYPKAKEADYPKLAASTSEIIVPSQDTSAKKALTKTEQADILSKMAGLSLERESPEVQRKSMSMYKRPSYAVINERNRIALLVNYFRLDWKDKIVYHYDIDISDSTKDNKIGRSVLSQGRTAKEDIKKKVKHVEREKRRNMGKAKCRQIISDLFKTNESLKRYCPVYDGQKNLFTTHPLPCKKEPIPVDISIEDKRKRFFVTITPVEKKDKTNIISLEPLKELYEGRSREIPYEVLLVYETVMNHRELPPFLQVQFRSSFFSLTGRKDYLGSGLEIWYGYHQSVQLTESGPVVVINLAAKAFHKAGPVIDYANDVLGKTDIRNLPRLKQWQIKSLTEALRGVQVKVTHQTQPRKYKIKGITDQTAEDLQIDINGRRISVARYFMERYQRRLHYPHLPCLHMQTNTNTTYIPMETCEIVAGQPKVGKLNAELTSRMIRETAVPPQRRMENIKRNATEVKNISQKYMGAFGLIMDIHLTKVDGRVMVAPQLEYSGQSIAKPDIKGVWRVEDGKKFYHIKNIDSWVLISFADRNYIGYNILAKYCDFLVRSARKCGMQLNRPQYVEIYENNIPTENAIIKAKKSGAQFAIIILNRKNFHHTYDRVKFLADFEYNLVTQCMEDKTLLRINDQITTNVCLKINVKLGGINHVLLQRRQIIGPRPVIILGVDAIHWTRGYGYPSIVSVVGSLDPTASRYALVCDLQRNEKLERISQEIIRNMDEIGKEILDAFVHANKGWCPEKIIVFRDGVSEGQFQHALDYEVSGLQQACRERFQKILPITFLVVQKRHQTRFFPVNPSQGVGKHQNVPPGTCVDKDITHPVFFDYFICSHEGIQGTSKPAHYTVLHDDNNFRCEELQQLCYFLCHTFVRCTRSVSLPAPIMYADLAATRAKNYADLHIASDSGSLSSGDEPRNLPSNVEKAIKSMKSFENNMFYI